MRRVTLGKRHLNGLRLRVSGFKLKGLRVSGFDGSRVQGLSTRGLLGPKLRFVAGEISISFAALHGQEVRMFKIVCAAIRRKLLINGLGERR